MENIQTGLVIIGLIFGLISAAGIPTGRFDATAAALSSWLASQLVHLLT